MSITPNRPSPQDKLRYSTNYLSGLTPAMMVSLYTQSKQGYLGAINGALQDLISREDISGLITTRVSALTRRELQLSQDDSVTPEIFEFCKFVIDNLKQYKNNEITGDLSDIIEQLAVTFYYGLSVNWIHWGDSPSLAYPIPLGIEHFDERRYNYDIYTDEIKIETDKASYGGETLNELSPGGLHIETIRVNQYTRIENAGIGRAILPIWHLKHQASLYQQQYAEKFAVPSVIISNDANVMNSSYDATQMADLQLFTQSYMNDCAAVLPPGFKPNLFATNVGGEKLFEFIEKSTKSQLAVEILGQDGTSSGSGGSLAKAQVNEFTKQDLIEGDCKTMKAFFQKIINKACWVYFGITSGIPKVYFAPSKADQESTTIDKLRLAKELGLKLPTSYLYKTLSIEPPKEGEVVL